MKKFNLYILIIAAAVLCSCTKQGNNLFSGYYSFKTSGSLTLESETLLGGTDTTTVQLSTENGQMNIVSEDNAAGTMKITMNVIGSDILVYNAETSADQLTVKPTKRYINIPGDWDPSKIEVTVTGTGKKYDKVVILDLNYSYTGEDYKIISSDIHCVGRENQ